MNLTLHLLDEINDSIQKYTFMLLVTNVLVGLLTWFALHWIGLENAGAWAVVAALLHVISQHVEQLHPVAELLGE
jgi:predicted PurR-regulated permease PerM